MANTVIGASVELEFQSVGQMRKAIKDATSDLIAMQEQFGKTSPQAIAAAKRIAELKDRIADAKEQADLFDPGKRFSAFANAANQIAAGFSAVQGAMALVGSESKDLEKTLVKVQGAVALSQGLSQLKDLGKAYDEVKIVAVNAFRQIKIAIGSTGIGLLLVALGSIVVYWDDIKAAVSGVSEEQKKLNKESEKNLQVQKDKLNAIDAQENTLKLQGKSEKDILKIKLAQTNEAIKAAEINLKNSIATTKAQVAAAQRNKDILQGIITFVTAPISALLKGIDLIGQAVGKNFDLYNKFTGGLASLVFDPAQVKAEGDASIKEQEKALLTLVNQRDGYQLQINDIDKKANEKKTADNKKSNEDRKNAEKELTQFLESEYEKRNNIGKDKFEIDVESTAKLYDEKIALAKKYNLDTEALEMARFNAIGQILNKESELRKNVFDKSLGDFKSQVPKLAAVDGTITVNAVNQAAVRKQISEDERKKIASDIEKYSQLVLQSLSIIRQANDTDLNIKKEQYNQDLANLQQMLDNKQISQEQFEQRKRQLDDEQNKQLIKAFKRNQILSIAEAIINTAKGVTNALSTLPPPFSFITAAATGALGVLQVKEIAKQKPGLISSSNISVPSLNTGQTTAPVTPGLSPAVQGQALNAEAINNLGNNAMRAYVLNSDIQNNDQRNAYLQRNARIG